MYQKVSMAGTEVCANFVSSAFCFCSPGVIGSAFSNYHVFSCLFVSVSFYNSQLFISTGTCSCTPALTPFLSKLWKSESRVIDMSWPHWSTAEGVHCPRRVSKSSAWTATSISLGPPLPGVGQGALAFALFLSAGKRMKPAIHPPVRNSR